MTLITAEKKMNSGINYWTVEIIAAVIFKPNYVYGVHNVATN